MVTGWILADKIHLSVTSIAFAGLGLLLMTSVLTAKDIATQGDTLSTFLWLAVLFALSSQLNELGFMGYVGQRLAAYLGGLSWPATYVALLLLYVAIHYMFVLLDGRRSLPCCVLSGCGHSRRSSKLR